MTKQELRDKYLTLRRQFSESEVDAKCRAITEAFFDEFDLSALTCVHVFLPIAHHKEVDTWRIIKKLWKAHSGIRTVVPKMEEGFSMTTCLLKKDTELEENKLKVPEPKVPYVVDEKEIDMVLVPMIICDTSGNRVGYGKGYYDTFFQKCRPDVLKVGLSLFGPVEAIADVDEWDEPLDFCVTPEKVFSF